MSASQIPKSSPNERISNLCDGPGMEEFSGPEYSTSRPADDGLAAYPSSVFADILSVLRDWEYEIEFTLIAPKGGGEGSSRPLHGSLKGTWQSLGKGRRYSLPLITHHLNARISVSRDVK